MRNTRSLILITTALIVVILFILGCKSAPGEVSVAASVVVDEAVIAGRCMGDCDGTASTDELAQLDSFFSQHGIGWFVGVFPLSLEDSNKSEVSSDVVFIQFGRYRLWGPYESEPELRNAWKGQAVDTPYLGIYVIEKSNGYAITHLYRSGGDHVYDGEWKEITITDNGRSYEALSVSLGGEFILHENQRAVIEGEDLEVEVVEFYNSPSPEGMECFWSGVGLRLEYRHAGEAKSVLVQNGRGTPELFGYRTTILDTDHETFARLTITRIMK